MEDQVLGWMDPIFRKQFLLHPKVANYKGGSSKKMIFIKIKQVSIEKRQTCTITQTFGYEAQESRAEDLYPIVCILVRWEIRELELLNRFDECLNYYKENPVQGLQRLYQRRRKSQKEKENDNFMLISFSCEAYLFTLGDIFDLLSLKKRSLSRNTANFFKGFFFKAYRTVLEMLNVCPKSVFGLSFCLEARDVLIDQFFRPLLRHPFARYPHPNLAFMNLKEERFIGPRILKEIYETMKKLNQFTTRQGGPSSDAYDQLLGIQNPLKQIYKIKDELEQAKKMSPSFLQFPDQPVLQELRNIMGDLYTISPLVNHEINRLNRLQTVLRCLGDKELSH